MFALLFDTRFPAPARTLRPLAAACLLAAVGFGSAACSQRSPLGAVGIAAPVAAPVAIAPQPEPATGSDPSVPAATEVFGRKVMDLSDPPSTF